jgi:chaperonin GroES
MGDRILIRRAAKETQTAGGIFLPTGDAAKSPNEGEVVSTGPGIRDISGVLHAPTLAKGDSVLLPEYGGMKIEVNKEELYLFREDDILGKFE